MVYVYPELDKTQAQAASQSTLSVQGLLQAKAHTCADS